MLIHYDKPEVAIMRIRCPPSSITMMLPTEVTKIPVHDLAFSPLVKLAAVPSPSANADVPEPATVVTTAHTTNQTLPVSTHTHTLVTSQLHTHPRGCSWRLQHSRPMHTASWSHWRRCSECSTLMHAGKHVVGLGLGLGFVSSFRFFILSTVRIVPRRSWKSLLPVADQIIVLVCRCM